MQNKGNMSARVSIALISKSEVDEVWRDAAHLVRLSQKRVESYTGMSDIYEDLLSGEMQLWLVKVEDKLKAAVVTMVEQHPRKSILRVMHVGGFDMKLWLDHLIDALTFAAKRAGCKNILADCRLGWAKKLPLRGWKEAARLYELEI